MANSSLLSFDDEFNSLSLWNGTTGTWDTDAAYDTPTDNGYTLASNGEQEWYINSNYAPTSSVTPWTVNNGVMTLTAAPASSAISSLINGYQYTSGQLNTYHSFSQTYGYFEERAQLPAGQGLWPAFWLMPENGSWPPELDIMEMLGQNPSTYYTTIHDNSLPNTYVGQADNVANTSTGYHTYAVDWEPDFITFYFDGQAVDKIATPADFNSPMYMITNLAVGGNWPGHVDSSTPIPAQMNVDWIRAYSSMPSWISDGQDPTDTGNEAFGGSSSGSTGTGSTGTGTTGTGSTGTGSTGTGSTGTGSSGSGSSGTVPTGTSAATYTVPSGITSVVMTGTGAQTVTANNSGDTITANDAASTIIGGTGNDTEIAGHAAVTMTGGGGHNIFQFPVLPWNAGHVTDFNPATDTLDLTQIFSAAGYTGSNPVADGTLSFTSDGAGDTVVTFHNAGSSFGTTIVTLNGVSPSSITSSDYIFAAGQTGNEGGASTGTGSTGTGSTGTGSTGTASTGTGSSGSVFSGSTPVNTTAATYTAPASVTNVVMTGTGAQTVHANNSGDTIMANDAASTIIGGTGNDTEIAGHGADTLTGGGGHDVFAFSVLPWNAGHVTDFNTATDTLNLMGVFSEAGYTGTNPVADGTLSFTSDGAGDTVVTFHDAGNPYGTTITTLNGVAPSSITSSDYVFAEGQTGNEGSGSSSTGTGSTGTGSTGTGSTGTGSTGIGSGTSSTPVHTTAASYTAPAGVTNIVMTGTGAQTVHANNSGDTITANDAASTIIGGTGNDKEIAGHGADMLTGGGGHNTFVFDVLPWNAGHITDFSTATDTLDLTQIFASAGYTGSNPVADGTLSFTSDGAGDTVATFHSASNPWGTTITTLDHVAPSSITSSDYVFAAGQTGNEGSSSTGTGSTGTGSTGTGSTGTGSTGTSSTPVHTTAASYTAPAGVTNIVMTGTGAQTVHANNLGDTITANDAASTIIGGTGNDTLIAGHGADTLTGGAGNDTFVFNSVPWNAGHITDFNTATDTLNLTGIFNSIGYTGSNPVADGYLSFVSDGHGDTQVYVNAHSASNPWSEMVTTLDHVSPASIASHDYIFHA